EASGEHVEAPAYGRLDRFRALRGDPDGRARLLQRLREDRRLRNLEELAVVAEWPALERLQQYVDRLLPARASALELESGRARWEESIDILLKAFEGRPFSYDGKLFKIPETTVFPQPLQQPRPPIWITAQSPESVEAAVRRGFNVLTGGF